MTISIPRVTTGGGTTYYGPASVRVTNHGGQVEASGTIALSGGSTTSALSTWIDEAQTGGLLNDSLDVGTLARLSTTIYNETGGSVDESRLYFSIPSTGAGTEGTNFDATYFGYNDKGVRWRTKTADGTITRNVYDSIGRQTQTWIGTNDNSFTGGEPSGTDNMVKVSSRTYDDDGPNTTGRNSNIATRIAYVVDSTTDQRVKTLTYDYRSRLIVQVNPTAPHAMSKFDNRGRRTAGAAYSASTGLDAADDPTTLATNRMTLSQSFYDEKSQVYKTQRHKVDDADGSDDDNLVSKSWFDESGRAIKTQGATISKTFYDGLGRPTHRFLIAEIDDSTYAHADDVAGDIVLSETQTTIEANSGNVLMSATISRFHDDYDVGETTGALDTNADADDLLYTATNLEGRIQITAMWYDDQDRLKARVNYGTNNGANFDRDGLVEPTGNWTRLKTSFTYWDDGATKDVSDPDSKETRTEYDDAGRRTAVITNYEDGAPSAGASDNYTRFVYTDGLLTKQWVDLDGDDVEDTGDQVTTYDYGVTKGVSAGDSKIARGDLLEDITYPDSTGGSDIVSYAYNAQGQRIYTKDQMAGVTEIDYDDSGRREHVRVTTLASGLDGAVRRISTVYDSLGRVDEIAQYNNATVGSGTLVNEVKRTYDDWGQLTNFEQDRDSAVGSGTPNDYEAKYTYAKSAPSAGWQTVRLTSRDLVYASTIKATTNYDYLSTAGSVDDSISRVSRVKSGAAVIASYDYLGQGAVVGIDVEPLNVMWNKFGTTSGSYPDLDRFNRTTTCKWTADLSTDKDFYDCDITYGRSGQVFKTDDQIYPSWDWQYLNDARRRLLYSDRGTFSGGLITNRKFKETWTLEQTGNWDTYTMDLNGDGDYLDAGEVNDNMSFNDANEITSGNVTYDAKGQMTDDGSDYDYEYDAFGRMRTIKNRTTAVLVAEYTYNGLGHRIGWHYDVDADGTVEDTADDPWTYYAYDAQWRVIGTFVAAATSPFQTFVHHVGGAFGRDGVAARTQGIRHYLLQNQRGDVITSIRSSDKLREGARYSAYGVPYALPTHDFDADGDADQDDEDFFDDLSGYDVRADFDLDGDIDLTDSILKLTSQLNYLAIDRGELSSTGNEMGLAGYVHDGVIVETAHVRNRVLFGAMGRWGIRNTDGYVDDGMGLYEYEGSAPLPAPELEPDDQSASTLIINDTEFFEDEDPSGGVPDLREFRQMIECAVDPLKCDGQMVAWIWGQDCEQDCGKMGTTHQNFCSICGVGTTGCLEAAKKGVEDCLNSCGEGNNDPTSPNYAPTKQAKAMCKSLTGCKKSPLLKLIIPWLCNNPSLPWVVPPKGPAKPRVPFDPHSSTSPIF